MSAEPISSTRPGLEAIAATVGSAVASVSSEGSQGGTGVPSSNVVGKVPSSNKQRWRAASDPGSCGLESISAVYPGLNRANQEPLEELARIEISIPAAAAIS